MRRIDGHQHLVKLAKHKDVQGFREEQLAKGDATVPTLSDETIDSNTVEIRTSMSERDITTAMTSPRAAAMATHVGDAHQNAVWADLNNDLISRACRMHPGQLIPVGMIGQSAIGDALETAKACAKQITYWAGLGFVGFNFDSDGTGGMWTGKPFTGEHNDPIFQAAHDMNVPLAIHGSESINPNLLHTALQYPFADMDGFVHLMIAMKKRGLFKTFKNLRFVIPHGAGLPAFKARWRWLAKLNGWATPEELLESGHVFIDTCVYDTEEMARLFSAVPVANLIFASESHGAFAGIINPETGKEADHTRLYIDSLNLPADDARKVYRDNVLRVYPGIAKWFGD